MARGAGHEGADRPHRPTGDCCRDQARPGDRGRRLNRREHALLRFGPGPARGGRSSDRRGRRPESGSRPCAAPSAGRVDRGQLRVHPQVVEQLRAASMGNRVMVDLDSAHDEGHVRAELDRLASLVTPGCYLVVEDTVGGGRPIRPEERRGAGPCPRRVARGGPAVRGGSAGASGSCSTTNHRGYLRRLGDGDTGAWVDDTPPCAVPSWTSVEDHARGSVRSRSDEPGDAAPTRAADGPSRIDDVDALYRTISKLQASEQMLPARITSDSFRPCGTARPA